MKDDNNEGRSVMESICDLGRQKERRPRGDSHET